MNQPVASLNLPQKSIDQLTENGIFCVNDYCDENDTLISNWNSFISCPPTKTAWELYQEELQSNKLNVNHLPESLRDFLSDEIAPRIVTELTGLPGSGKTQLCLHLALSGDCFYVCTNRNFSSLRIREIVEKSGCFENVEDVLFKINFIEIMLDWELKGFVHFLKNWLSENKISILIIDSIAWILKHMDPNEKQPFIYCFLQEIRNLANLHQFAVLITNEMTIRLINQETCLTSASGEGFFHGINNRILLAKENEMFSAEIVKSVTDGCKKSKKVYYKL